MNLSFNNLWPYLWSIGVVAVGSYFILKKNIGVGIKGSPPKFHIDGIPAIIIGLIIIILGFFFLFNPDILR
jgi:hypothetical protein